MTTAEPPEPLTVQHTEIILFKQILQQIVGSGGEAFLSILCDLWFPNLL